MRAAYWSRSALKALMRSSIASIRTMTSNSTSSSSDRRFASDCNSCCSCSNSLGVPVPDASLFSSRSIRLVTCSTSTSDLESSCLISAFSVSAAITKSLAELNEIRATSSALAAGIFFNL